jgi:hypothetical protein
MYRRSFLQVLVVGAAFIAGFAVSNRPMSATAQPPAGHGKCVGVAVYQRIAYRAFEDGTVELNYDPVNLPGQTNWQPVGK